jgi:DNA-binding MarR family transcriptional regulator
MINITSERIGQSNAALLVRILVLAHRLSVAVSSRLSYERHSVVEALALFMLRHHDHVSLAGADLGRELGLSRTSSAQLLSRLVADEMITLTSDPKDARRRVIVLTDEGKLQAEDFIETLEERGGMLVTRFDDRAKRELIWDLDVMTHLAEQSDPRRWARRRADNRVSWTSRY